MDFGSALRRHRLSRGKSQLALSLDAGVSTRHLSCIETSRASPSREMVLQLADALQLSLRERNALLLSAGYAPHFEHTPLDAAPMREIRALIELLLRRNEPFGAFVIDRRWDIVMLNDGYAAMLALLLNVQVPSYEVLPEGRRPNVLRAFFDPNGLRRFVLNWEEVALDVLRRVHRERALAEPDVAAVLDEILSRKDLPRGPTPRTSRLVMPLQVQLANVPLSFFVTLSTIATPQDVTLDELRVECLHPASQATADVVQQLRRT